MREIIEFSVLNGRKRHELAAWLDNANKETQPDKATKVQDTEGDIYKIEYVRRVKQIRK